MAIARLGLVYFTLVFAVGFALGVVRTLWLAPSVGAEQAEIIEIPLMMVVCWWVARYAIRGTSLGSGARFAAGALALACLLTFEFTVVLALRDETLASWAASRASLAGALWAASMVLFALLPGLLAPREPGTGPR